MEHSKVICIDHRQTVRREDAIFAEVLRNGRIYATVAFASVEPIKPIIFQRALNLCNPLHPLRRKFFKIPIADSGHLGFKLNRHCPALVVRLESNDDASELRLASTALDRVHVIGTFETPIEPLPGTIKKSPYRELKNTNRASRHLGMGIRSQLGAFTPQLQSYPKNPYPFGAQVMAGTTRLYSNRDEGDPVSTMLHLANQLLLGACARQRCLLIHRCSRPHHETLWNEFTTAMAAYGHQLSSQHLLTVASTMIPVLTRACFVVSPQYTWPAEIGGFVRINRGLRELISAINQLMVAAHLKGETYPFSQAELEDIAKNANRVIDANFDGWRFSGKFPSFSDFLERESRLAIGPFTGKLQKYARRIKVLTSPS